MRIVDLRISQLQGDVSFDSAFSVFLCLLKSVDLKSVLDQIFSSDQKMISERRFEFRLVPGVLETDRIICIAPDLFEVVRIIRGSDDDIAVRAGYVDQPAVLADQFIQFIPAAVVAHLDDQDIFLLRTVCEAPGQNLPAVFSAFAEVPDGNVGQLLEHFRIGEAVAPVPLSDGVAPCVDFFFVRLVLVRGRLAD